MIMSRDVQLARRRPSPRPLSAVVVEHQLVPGSWIGLRYSTWYTMVPGLI